MRDFVSIFYLKLKNISFCIYWCSGLTRCYASIFNNKAVGSGAGDGGFYGKKNCKCSESKKQRSAVRRNTFHSLHMYVSGNLHINII